MWFTEEDTELLVKALIDIHDDIISATQSGIHKTYEGLPVGGMPGVRDQGGLHVLAYKIFSLLDKKIDGIELGTEIMHEIATKHFFWDGNKRTAYVVSKTFMSLKGVSLKPNYQDALEFMVKVAANKANKAEIRKWVQENSA